MNKEILIERLNLLCKVISNKTFYVYNDKEKKGSYIWKNDIKRWIKIINLNLAKDDDIKFYMKSAQNIWETIWNEKEES